MPFLMIYGPELLNETKSAIACDMTAAISNHYKVPPSMVSVFFVPLGQQDAFHAGKPIQDEGGDGN